MKPQRRSKMGPIPRLLLYALLLLALVATPSLGKESFGQPGKARFLRTQPSPPRPASAPHINKSPPPSPWLPPPHHHHPPPSPKNCYLSYPPPPPKIRSPLPPHMSRGRPRPTPPTPVSSPHIFHSPPPPNHPPPALPIPTPPPYMW